MVHRITPQMLAGGAAVYFATAVGAYLYLRGDKAAKQRSSASSSSAASSAEGGGGAARGSWQERASLDPSVWSKLATVYDKEIDMDETVMGMRLLRRWLAHKAEGDVLEVSCGTGRNLKYFDLRSGSAISSLTLTDSNREMLQHAWDKYRDMMRLEPAVPVRFTLADAQALSGGSGAAAGDAAPSPPPRAPGFGPQFAAPETFATAQFDTVVETFGLCSCSDPVQSLKEMARVCKPGGRILLLEHGRGTWDWVNGVLDAGEERHCARWGCQWNRPILELVAAAGLEVESVSRWHFGTTCLVTCRCK